MLSDRRYPSFWNFDSTISIDVIRMKSYMDSLFDPTCVPVFTSEGHLPIWKKVKFIDRDPHWYTRRVKEAVHIRLHPNNI